MLEETRWLLNQELALSYHSNENLTDIEAQEVLTAVFTSNTLSSNRYYAEKFYEFQIEELLQKHADAFIRITDGPEKNHLLNRLAEISTGDKLEKEWKADPAFPHFITTDETYKIDLSLCTASSSEGTNLPPKVAKHPDVIKIFKGNPPKKCTKLGENAFLVSFEGNNYRILIVKNEVVIQREFQEEGTSVWGQYTKRNKEIEEAIPPHFTKRFNLWVYETSPASLVMTNSANQIVARVVGNKFYQVDPLTNKNTGLTLDDSGSSAIAESLSGFEDKNYFSIWVDGNSLSGPQQIEFPRLGISFYRQKVGNKDRMVSNAFPGYYIAEKQYVAELQDDFSFILLENGAGEKQVILPKHYYIAGLDSKKGQQLSLDTSKHYFDLKTDSSHLYQCDFYQYKLDSKTGELKASSLEAKFYLSMRHLWMMRYEKAEALLKGFDTFLRPYSAKEIDLLMQIANLKEVSGDQDPRATAISLHAAYLLHRNSRDFAVDLAERPDIFELYNTYLDQLNNIYAVRLDPEEELLLLTILPNKNEAMVNRLVALDPARGRIAQAKLSMERPPSKVSNMPYGLAENIEEFFPTFQVRSWSSEKKEPKIVPTLRTQFNMDLFKSTYNFIKKNHASEFNKDLFTYIYTFIKMIFSSEKLTEEEKKFHELFTGLDYQEPKWKEEFISSLRLMTTTPNQQSNTLAWLLLAYFEHPLKINLEPFFNEKTHQNYYKNTLVPQLHSLYPELKQEVSSHFARMEKLEEILDSPISNQEKLLSNEYRHCVALKPVSKYQVVETFNGIILQSASATQSESELRQLKGAFSGISTTDPVVNDMMKDVIASINLYQESSASHEGTFSLSSLQDLNLYAHKILQALNEAEPILRDQEMVLLQKANRPAADLLKHAKEEILTIGQSRQPLTVDDLIQLYWNRDVEQFHQQNPHLTVDEIHQLTSGIQNMLIQATYVQQLKRILSQIDLIRKNLGSSELSDHLKLLKSYIDATHAYQIDQHPEYLVLEYYADILLRSEQLKNLDLLQIRDGKIHDRQHLGTALEMIMGSGKTFVLMPLLGILNADGDILSIGVFPFVLLPSMSEILARTLGTAYKKVVEVVSVTRETPIDDAFLARIQTIRSGKKLMLMDDSSVKSLYLSFIEHLYTYSHASKERRAKMEDQRQIFIEIFTLLNKKGSVIADEIDQILHPRTEKLYTLGNSVSMPDHEVDLIANFYEILETVPDIYQALRFEYSDPNMCSVEDQEAKKTLIEKTYENVVKPKLIDLIIKRMMGGLHAELQQFFSDLTPNQMALVKEYLSASNHCVGGFYSKTIAHRQGPACFGKRRISKFVAFDMFETERSKLWTIR